MHDSPSSDVIQEGVLWLYTEWQQGYLRGKKRPQKINSSFLIKQNLPIYTLTLTSQNDLSMQNDCVAEAAP